MVIFSVLFIKTRAVYKVSMHHIVYIGQRVVIIMLHRSISQETKEETNDVDHLTKFLNTASFMCLSCMTIDNYPKVYTHFTITSHFPFYEFTSFGIKGLHGHHQ
jgi:hypothetical protein